MGEVDLGRLADAGALVSNEHQQHLEDALDIAGWDVDATAGTFTATDSTGTDRIWRAHFIGTSSPTDGTWLWAWQNVNGFPDAFVRQSRRIRALGEREGIAEFTTAALPLHDELPLRLMRAVKAVTGVTAHYSAPTGNAETRAWLLLESDDLALPDPSVIRTVGVITSTIAGTEIHDHRRAVTAWAEQRGARTEPVGGDVLRLHLPDGSLELRFDEHRRIANMGTRLGAARQQQPAAADPPPAPQPEPAPPAHPYEAVDDEEEAPTIEGLLAAAPEVPARPGLLRRLLGRG